ncbi:MAG: DNA/RNA non-specific endonuclease, partial [Bacteroidaceae bacterium]|nr:DNA/RNA non-specific endonuclease [Bacteroidaceae bacterium]
ELTKSETYGDVERTDYFDVDPSITGRQAKFGDYSHTGFDRGHMAPAGDMKWSKEAMDACFYLTNICPQNHALNKGDWNDLEIKCRKLARKYGRAWIVTGPIVTSKEPKTIGSHHVVVPDAFFKAILVPNGSSYAAIAFVMDNAPGDGDIMNDVISIDSLENLTGIDFFYALPDEVEDVVEADYKLSIWR